MKTSETVVDRPLDVLLDSLTANEYRAITAYHLSNCISMHVGRSSIEEHFGVDWTDAQWKEVRDRAEDYWVTPWDFAFELVQEAAGDLGYELSDEEDYEDEDDDEA